MKKIMKAFVVLLAVVFIISAYSGLVFAEETEDDSAGKQSVVEVNSETINNDTDDSGNGSAVIEEEIISGQDTEGQNEDISGEDIDKDPDTDPDKDITDEQDTDVSEEQPLTEPEEKIAVSSVKLDTTSATMLTEQSLELHASVFPEDATDKTLIWESSNEAVATVDENGVVSAKRYGTAEITVYSASDPDKKASCSVKTYYYDVASSSLYYYKPVYWAAEQAITQGYDQVFFGAERTCTRREMMIFLWRLSGEPAGSGSMPFNDMKYGPETDTYKAILWGSSKGIVKGYSDGSFKTEDPVKRKDVLIMLYRLAGKPLATGLMEYPDVLKQKYSIYSDTYNSILWAAKYEITKGYSDGNFKPLANCLREHIVTFIYRYINNDRTLVVCLDPGHDRRHIGASNGIYKEEEMNLKISLACKKELETYEGVKVVITRSTMDCPRPAYSETGELEWRVAYAVDHKADVLISQHINAGGGNAKGVMIIPQVPSTYRRNLEKISLGVCESIRDELFKLGFGDAGTYFRYSTNGSTYPDGSDSDYYAITYCGKMYNIPSMIIEHGYIDKSDLRLLNTDAKLEAVGKADAAGIAKYYGLVKK